LGCTEIERMLQEALIVANRELPFLAVIQNYASTLFVSQSVHNTHIITDLVSCTMHALVRQFYFHLMHLMTIDIMVLGSNMPGSH